MKIERIREILRAIPIDDDVNPDGFDEQSELWEIGFEAGIEEAIKYLEAEAMSETSVIDEVHIFDNTGMCNILGEK